MSIKLEKSYGVIPIRRSNGQLQFLLIQHQAGHWGFPKGHPRGDESPPETAAREAREETGLQDITLQSEPTFREAYHYPRNGEKVNKEVEYWLGFTGQANVNHQPGELKNIGWFEYSKARQWLTFEAAKALLDRVNRLLTPAR